MAQKVDWKAIEHEYVTTKASQKALAEKYGISKTAIGEACRKQGWVEKRKAHVQRVVDTAAKKTAAAQARKLSSLMQATDKLGAAIEKALSDQDQLYRHIVSVGQGDDVEERVFKKMDTRAVRDLTASLKELTGLVRDFYGIPTQAQAEAQRIAAERLELERRKVEAGQDHGDNTIEVIMGGSLEDYTK